LGAKPGFGDLFIIICGKGWGFVGISENSWATLENDRDLCIIILYSARVDSELLKMEGFSLKRQ
jgi:hypothetical protein